MVDPPAANDHELQALMDERAEQLAAWRDDDRAIAAASMALFYPTLRGAYVARLERHADLSAADALVFLRVESPPPWAWDRARTALRSSDAATRVAAALLLARQVPMSPELGAELDGILVLGCLTALSRVLVLQDLGIPELPKGPFGPSPDARADGTVVFAGANLVTLRVEDRNVTLRFRPEGLAKGDAIRLGRDAGGRPRVLEWTTSDGVARRVDVAPDGTRLA